MQINGIEYAADTDTDAKWVSARAHPVDVAREQERWLTEHGHVASWAPDGYDRALAWIYVDWKEQT